jgi:general stress protein YciG
MMVYRLAEIFNIRTPEMYEFYITLNGNNQTGYIQKMIPVAQGSAGFSQRKIEKMFSAMLIDETFGWLLHFVFTEMLLSQNGEVYMFDLNAECWKPENRDDDDQFTENFSGMNDLCGGAGEVYGFLEHVNRIEDAWLLKQSGVSLCRGEGIENELMKNVLKQKRKLSFFINDKRRYPEAGKKGGRLSCFVYRAAMCIDLGRDIAQKSIALTRKKSSNGRKNEFRAISSGNTLNYLADKAMVLRRNSDAKIPGWKDSCLSVEKELSSMRYACDILEEKLAITVYLRQVKTLNEYLKRKEVIDIFLTAKRDIFIPVLYNVNSFTYAFADEWYARIHYQTAVTVPVAVSEGEREYITGLLALMNSQVDEAEKLLAIAKEKGYAVEEIDDITIRYVLGGKRGGKP